MSGGESFARCEPRGEPSSQRSWTPRFLSPARPWRLANCRPASPGARQRAGPARDRGERLPDSGNALLYIRAGALPAWTLQTTRSPGAARRLRAWPYFSGEVLSPLVPSFYLWVFLYASYFFSHRQTAVQILYVGLAYGVLLATTAPASAIPTWWLVGMRRERLLVGAVVIMVMQATARRAVDRTPLRRGAHRCVDLALKPARLPRAARPRARASPPSR